MIASGLVRLSFGLSLVGLAFINGCSTFNRDWEANAQSEAARSDAAAAGLEGRWNGTWLSDANGHTGGLRCILSKDEEGTLQARYHATWGCCFSFEYTVPVTATQEGDTHNFHGEADLGWFAGGLYKYDGQVTGDDFSSNYSCERDHGTFQMTRVVGTESPEADAQEP